MSCHYIDDGLQAISLDSNGYFGPSISGCVVWDQTLCSRLEDHRLAAAIKSGFEVQLLPAPGCVPPPKPKLIICQ